MKLTDHVNHIRSLIYKAYNNRFARLGLGEKNEQDISLIPEELHSLRDQLDEMLENHIGETGSYKLAREKALDELSFTLFNRIAAIKVMEARHLFPEIITKRTEHGDRSFAHKAWLELNPNGRNLELEGLEFFLEHEFDKLSEKMQLFGKDHPYALMPFTIDLNDIIDAFNAVEQDKDTGADTWQSDDILGWLYESYNSLKKKEHKDSGKKTEFDKVSLQSQVYTPRWVVKFLVDNSLGKLYLEMFPNSQIKEKYAIANAPQTRVREKKPLHEIKLIDPAPGSGNFLLYAFDLFYDLYTDQIDNYGADYDEEEIPALIIENNLYGIDLDDRAVQLAQMGLFIKALTRQRGFKMRHVNVVSSDFYLPKYADIKLFFEEGANFDQAQKELMEEVWTDLQQAYRFGSLIKVGERVNERLEKLEKKNHKNETLNMFETQNIVDFQIFRNEFFAKLEQAVARYAQSKNNNFLKTKANDALTFLKILANKYDVAVANPPYTDSADFGPELKSFIDTNYKSPWKFNINLYSTFIKRCYDLTSNDGKMALIHPHTFMFIKSFEDVRQFMIEKTHIDMMVDLGLDRVNLFGPGILLDATFYVLSKTSSIEKGVYFNLTTNLQEKFKKEQFLKALTDFIVNEPNNRVYKLDQTKLGIIKSSPFIYWISDAFREKFGYNSIGEIANVAQGASTGKNERFVRFWWEIKRNEISLNYNEDRKRYIFYSKGGVSNKWYGNIWLVIDWNNDGDLMLNYGKCALRNKQHYFKEGITCSGRSSSKGMSYRYMPSNQIFDVGATGIIQKGNENIYCFLGFLNSSLYNYIINCLNPTVNTSEGDVSRVPYKKPNHIIEKNIVTLSSTNIDIKKHHNIFSLIEPSYSKSPITFTGTLDLPKRIKRYFDYDNHLLTQVLINESIINENIFEVYDLTHEDRTMVVTKEGESIGALAVESEAKSAYLAEEEATKEFTLDHIRTFIEELPEKSFSAEEKEAIISEFPNLYKSNNDLEEFCIRHQVNPINVWYWFKQSKVLPVHRAHDIAMEFLADLLREILLEDDDGIVPLVRNSGEEVLVNRIEKKFYEKGFSTAQYSQFSSLLGREIDEYINHHFFGNFSDHLNLFMYLPKTPFIWHITSGKHGAFEAYIIIYKWSKDKLFSIKSKYVEKRESALIREKQDTANSNTVSAQEAQERIPKQLDELQEFKQKIDELLAGGYDPKLDDGVGKNIAPLQKRGMITYDVLNPGQLEKYLNADW
ncbi:type II restriction enzyme methylase subunit [Aquipluma nitroreducens]|uniref:site-specific DNA-methyltransferase (adenine-specific) n=1 Tax=Aquipluma nitroreducens TaxID=2010828 RepID=A0A5K7SB99_9BACT|nr:BREX-1 system adenine-specific DNA-methyltransferase PglX [Aquipluma nitroreducens]BBE18574.1 type II restriction enzyme methylase subunit [Aquipluma nitroreducens]